MILIENWAAFLRNQTLIWLLEGAVVSETAIGGLLAPPLLLLLLATCDS